MKKITSGRYSRQLPPVFLYEGDLQQIVDVLADKAGTVVSLQCGDTLYESIAELREHEGDVLHSLDVRARFEAEHKSGSCSVDLADKFTYLSGDSGFELQCRRVEELLRAKTRLSGKVPYQYWFAGYSLLILLLIGLPTIMTRGFGLTGTPSIVVSIVCFIGWAIMLSGKVRFRRNTIVLRKRHETQNLAQRYGPEILKDLLIAVASGLIVYWFTKN